MRNERELLSPLHTATPYSSPVPVKLWHIADMKSIGQLLIFFGIVALWGSLGVLQAKDWLPAMACALTLGIAAIGGGIVLIRKSKPKS
jgi:hypothetical protein